MQLNRIRVTTQADNYLRQMKAKTGLTPNLLCRIGFCLSLREPAIPRIEDYEMNDSPREFNRFTLLGQYDDLFIALLIERCRNDGLRIPEDLDDQFRAHVNRGVILLFQRMKHISDLGRLIQEAYS